MTKALVLFPLTQRTWSRPGGYTACILAVGCSSATLERRETPSHASISITAHNPEQTSESTAGRPQPPPPPVSYGGAPLQHTRPPQFTTRDVSSPKAPDEHALAPDGVLTASWFAPESIRVAFNITDWLRSHKIHAPEGMSGICQTLEGVGVPPSEGFVCLELRDPLGLHDGRSLIIGTIYIVDSGSLRPVLRAPVGAGALYIEGCSPLPCAQRFYVRLVPKLSGEGRRLSLVEDPERPCTMTREALDRIKALGTTFVQQQRQLETIACTARGDYIWQKGRYLRRSEVPVQSGQRTSSP